MIDHLHLLWILAVCCGVCVAAVVMLWLKLQKQSVKFNLQLQKIQQEIAVVSSSALGFGQRVIALEKQVQSIKILSQAPVVPTTSVKEEAVIEREIKPVYQERSSSYYQEDEFKSYSDAAQLFSMGFSSEEVAQRCGLSRAEASLLQVMQQNEKV